MGHLQPSRVTSSVTSSEKWRTSSPPATFVRNRVLHVKFLAKFSARAARSLAMQIGKSLSESHPRVTSMQISEDESHLSTSRGHIREKFRGQSHPSGHIRNHIRTKSSHFQEPTLRTWHDRDNRDRAARIYRRPPAVDHAYSVCMILYTIQKNNTGPYLSGRSGRCV